MFELIKLISCIYDDDNGVTVVYVETGEGRKHFHREDPDKQLYNLVSDYQADPNDDRRESLVKALTPKSQIVEQFSAINSTNFTFSNGRAYLSGTKVPVPEAIAVQLNKYVQEGHDVTSLLNFWALCLLNPNVDARNRFYDYCLEYGATLTPTGHVFLYKNVELVKGLDIDERLTEFIKKVEAEAAGDAFRDYEVWVHDVMNVYVLREPVFGELPVDASIVGTVGEIDDQIGDKYGLKAKYTDHHTGLMDIQLGKAVSINRNLCDPDISKSCSIGLHVGSYRYVRHFSNSRSITLGVLVNPANIVALPDYDNSKIRVCEYFPTVLMTRDEDGDWSEIPSAFTEVDYQDYQRDEGVFADALVTSEVDGQNVVVTQTVIDFYDNNS